MKTQKSHINYHNPINTSSLPSTNLRDRKLLIFGASGHAKDVMDPAILLGYRAFALVTTDGNSQIAEMYAQKEANFKPSDYLDWDCIVAIGNNTVRKKLYENYSNLRQVNIISPSAIVSPSARISEGCYVGAFAYVGPCSTLSEATIVNSHSIIGHDSIVGAFSQIGPKVCISGNVHIGKSVYVGAGAIFNNGSEEAPLMVPDFVEIGMGCHITRTVEYKGLKLLPKPNYIIVQQD